MASWEMLTYVMTTKRERSQKIHDQPLLSQAINKAIMSIISRQQIQVLGCLASVFRDVFAQSAASVKTGLLTNQANLWSHVSVALRKDSDLKGSDCGPEIHQTLLGAVLSMHSLML